MSWNLAPFPCTDANLAEYGLAAYLESIRRFCFLRIYPFAGDYKIGDPQHSGYPYFDGADVYFYNEGAVDSLSFLDWIADICPDALTEYAEGELFLKVGSEWYTNSSTVDENTTVAPPLGGIHAKDNLWVKIAERNRYHHFDENANRQCDIYDLLYPAYRRFCNQFDNYELLKPIAYVAGAIEYDPAAASYAAGTYIVYSSNGKLADDLPSETDWPKLYTLSTPTTAKYDSGSPWAEVAREDYGDYISGSIAGQYCQKQKLWENNYGTIPAGAQFSSGTAQSGYDYGGSHYTCTQYICREGAPTAFDNPSDWKATAGKEYKMNANLHAMVEFVLEKENAYFAVTDAFKANYLTLYNLDYDDLTLATVNSGYEQASHPAWGYNQSALEKILADTITPDWVYDTAKIWEPDEANIVSTVTATVRPTWRYAPNVAGFNLPAVVQSAAPTIAGAQGLWNSDFSDASEFYFTGAVPSGNNTGRHEAVAEFAIGEVDYYQYRMTAAQTVNMINELYAALNHGGKVGLDATLAVEIATNVFASDYPYGNFLTGYSSQADARNAALQALGADYTTREVDTTNHLTWPNAILDPRSTIWVTPPSGGVAEQDGYPTPAIPNATTERYDDSAGEWSATAAISRVAIKLSWQVDLTAVNAAELVAHFEALRDIDLVCQYNDTSGYPTANVQSLVLPRVDKTASGNGVTILKTATSPHLVTFAFSDGLSSYDDGDYRIYYAIYSHPLTFTGTIPDNISYVELDHTYDSPSTGDEYITFAAVRWAYWWPGRFNGILLAPPHIGTAPTSVWTRDANRPTYRPAT